MMDFIFPYIQSDIEKFKTVPKKIIRKMVDTSSEFDVLTDRIMHAVDDQVKGLSAEYAIDTAQCLMRAEATKSDDYKEIYYVRRKENIIQRHAGNR